MPPCETNTNSSPLGSRRSFFPHPSARGTHRSHHPHDQIDPATPQRPRTFSTALGHDRNPVLTATRSALRTTGQGPECLHRLHVDQFRMDYPESVLSQSRPWQRRRSPRGWVPQAARIPSSGSLTDTMYPRTLCLVDAIGNCVQRRRSSDAHLNDRQPPLQRCHRRCGDSGPVLSRLVLAGPGARDYQYFV